MNFEAIKVDKPSDIIIKQIRELINSGTLKAGDVLPPERKLSESFGVGRGHVREAIKKLEFYGILKTQPQSGTVVAGMGITAMQGLISNILDLEGHDFYSLVETRTFLEVEATGLAAARRTQEDLAHIEAAMLAYEKAVKENQTGLDSDFMFHLAIADAAQNSSLKSLLMVIMPDILEYFSKEEVCTASTKADAVEVHRKIFDFIVAQDVEGAKEAMLEHLKPVLEQSKLRSL
ncbi:FadR/GntR family transcriptional regulator [Persicobacter psychrovividus]